jgi:hypothetical protein
MSQDRLLCQRLGDAGEFVLVLAIRGFVALFEAVMENIGFAQVAVLICCWMC